MAKRKKLQSARADGRGHWPAGKPRSSVDARTRQRLLRAIRRANERDGLSLKSIARTIEVNDRTLRRWLAEEDHPSPELAQAALSRLLG